MTEFEQTYLWWLEELAAAQDRCEYAVATIVRYEEAGQPIPPETATAYAEAHETLRRVSSHYPLPSTLPLPLASNA